MRRINVIDLDGTLLPYDSLSRWIRHFKQAEGLTSPLRFWGLLFRLGWMSRSTFVRRCVDHLRSREDYRDFNRSFANQLIRDLDSDILQRVSEQSNEKTLNILCSASPEDYVKHIADQLGWICRASGYRSDGKWQLMHGEEKLRCIRKEFPSREFEYHLALADDDSDQPLLDAFTASERIRHT